MPIPKKQVIHRPQDYEASNENVEDVSDLLSEPISKLPIGQVNKMLKRTRRHL